MASDSFEVSEDLTQRELNPSILPMAFYPGEPERNTLVLIEGKRIKIYNYPDIKHRKKGFYRTIRPHLIPYLFFIIALLYMLFTCYKMESLLNEMILQSPQYSKYNIFNHLTDKCSTDNQNFEADYASASAGASIIRVISTKTYFNVSDTVMSRFWISVMVNHENHARKLLEPNIFPGECWAFEGTTGAVVIKLVNEIHITQLALEHIPLAKSPYKNISSAPKHFSIMGVNSEYDNEGFDFGRFRYSIEGPPLQRFTVEYFSPDKYQFIIFNVTSNWGNNDYTCVYKLNVYG